MLLCSNSAVSKMPSLSSSKSIESITPSPSESMRFTIILAKLFELFGSALSPEIMVLLV